MRVTPLVGQKVWFGPHHDFGWGWTPISWEGWAVFGVSLVLIVALGLVGEYASDALPVLASIWAVVALLVTTCLFKGTSPGGPRRAEAFRRLTALAARRPSDI